MCAHSLYITKKERVNLIKNTFAYTFSLYQSADRSYSIYQHCVAAATALQVSHLHLICSWYGSTHSSNLSEDVKMRGRKLFIIYLSSVGHTLKDLPFFCKMKRGVLLWGSSCGSGAIWENKEITLKPRSLSIRVKSGADTRILLFSCGEEDEVGSSELFPLSYSSTLQTKN